MYILRELCRSDIPTINAWRADKELVSQLGAPFRYINEDVDQRWFDAYMENRSNTIRCSIVDDSAPETILGLITLSDIDWLNRKCQLHIMVGPPEMRGNGLGTFAVNEMLRHAFEVMNLNRVELFVLVDNEHARALYTKCGFKTEGVLRQYAFKDGRYKDSIIMSVLRVEYNGSNSLS